MAGVSVTNLFHKNSETGEQERDLVGEAYIQRLGNRVMGIELQSDLFSNITFPSVPNNFEMLMSDLAYPDKAKKNPNGLLFMKPKDIDANSANDIAMQCFGNSNLSKSKITGTLDTENPNESLSFDNMIIKMLFEDTGDPALGDSNIKQQDIKTRNEKYSTLNVNVAHAITNYINRSISIIKPLLEMVAGQEGKSLIKKITKDILTANATLFKNVKDYLLIHSEVEKEKDRFETHKIINELQDQDKYLKFAENVIMCMLLSNSKADIEFLTKLYKKKGDIKNSKDLDYFVSLFTDYDDYRTFAIDFKKNNEKPFKIRVKETINYKGKQMLVEDAIEKIFEEDDSSSSALDIIDYDEIYDNLVSYLTTSINEAIGPREDWTCIKKVAEEMKLLKEKANEEILHKIDLICKTGVSSSNSTNSSSGKGVHAIVFSKDMPYKAEGLKGMWSRYDSELLTRINSRIASLTGSTGSVSSGSALFVEDFLRNTYPTLIAVMLTYKLLFQQMSFMYKRGMTLNCTLEEKEELIELSKNTDSGYMGLIEEYDKFKDLIK